MTSSRLKDRTLFIIVISAILLLACASAVVIFFMVFGSDIFNPSQSATPTLPSAQTDPVWERIMQNKQIVVGLSPDYPPFSYVDQNFSIQGYDLALIQAIGKRLNIPLEIRSMAFDGLVNSLILGQIDVAVAAISITPERDQVIDFSNVYYVGEDAILAHIDSAIQVEKMEDLANYRLGVQKGSVYEDWITDNLVTPGLLQPQYLVAFETPDEALNALSPPNQQVDLVILDAQPAELAEKSSPVKIVARGLNPQRFAIALPQGALTLQAHLNQAITEMQNSGELEALAKRYLDVDNPPPLPTPGPTQAPVPPQGCLDGMKFVQDLNYPDSNMTQPAQFQPGAVIQKGWRIQNTGTCVWDNSYTLAYIGSIPPNAPVGGNPAAIQGQVAPGQTYDIFASIVAPPQPARYQSFWNLRNPQGQYFGDRLWIGFDVIAAATPTPGPQAPTIFRFLVDRNQIVQGQCLNLSWQFGGQNISRSRLFRNNQLILQDMPYSGSAPDCPPFSGNIEYRLQVDSQSAGSTVASQYVIVIPPAQPTYTPVPTPQQPPLINFFIVDDDQIQSGQCIKLSWSFSGSNLTSKELYRNRQSISTNLSPTGSQQDCLYNAGQYEYLLRITSQSYGSAESRVYVRVLDPEPTQAPLPVVNSFTVSPDEINLGECVSLSWSFSAPMQVNAQITRNGQTILSDPSFSGGYQDCITDQSLIGQVRYTLLIAYAPGGVITADQWVTVNSGAPLLPIDPLSSTR